MTPRDWPTYKGCPKLFVNQHEFDRFVAHGLDPEQFVVTQPIPEVFYGGPLGPPLEPRAVEGKLTVDMIEKAKELAKSCKSKTPIFRDEDGKDYYVLPITAKQHRHYRYNFGSTAVRLIMDIEDRINGRN